MAASECALREADRRKDEFLAILARELRNPLSPIRSVTHIVSMASATPEAIATAHPPEYRSRSRCIKQTVTCSAELDRQYTVARSFPA